MAVSGKSPGLRPLPPSPPSPPPAPGPAPAPAAPPRPCKPLPPGPPTPWKRPRPLAAGSAGLPRPSLPVASSPAAALSAAACRAAIAAEGLGAGCGCWRCAPAGARPRALTSRPSAIPPPVPDAAGVPSLGLASKPCLALLAGGNPPAPASALSGAASGLSPSTTQISSPSSTAASASSAADAPGAGPCPTPRACSPSPCPCTSSPLSPLSSGGGSPCASKSSNSLLAGRTVPGSTLLLDLAWWAATSGLGLGWKGCGLG